MISLKKKSLIKVILACVQTFTNRFVSNLVFDDRDHYALHFDIGSDDLDVH